MRKANPIFPVLLCVLVLHFNSNCQDVINQHIDYSILSNPVSPIVNNQNPSYPFQYNTQFPNNPTPTGAYDGEYEIYFPKFFWYNWLVQAPGSGGADYVSLSYQYEIVSFPFTLNCAFTPACCGFNCSPTPPANYTDDRKLFMPDATAIYNSTYETWTYPIHPNAILYGKTPLRKVLENFTSGGIAGSGNQNPGHTLISKSFFNTSPPDFDSYVRELLPHSVIKHTINFHCDTQISSSVVASLSWITDNTRGRMRYYPFSNSNCDQSSPNALYDMVFMPELLLNDAFEHYTVPPSDIILPGNGTLNYFPFNEISANGCISSVLNFPTDPVNNYFFYAPSSDNSFDYIYPSPGSLVTAPLRQYQGTSLAGYSSSNNFLTSLNTNSNLRHQYNIDRNLDLTILNSTDKVIYNPSEVTITADNLIFPSGYTFKTIRGIYPSEVDAIAENLSTNGGPWDDLRQVPARTDVRSENPADPHSASDNDAVYASRYYLQNGSKITVQECTRIFDATFDVQQGATLIFDDHNQMLGLEDKSSNVGRYKIHGLGGAVLRNQDAIQYVQNGVITQTQQLHYHATDQLVSGYDVDPDTDQPDGEYEIEANGDVVFTAINEVHLADGFHAKENSTFHAYIDPVINANICPAWNAGNQRMAHSPSVQKHHMGDAVGSLMITPNPGNGEFRVYNVLRPLAASTLTVSDVMGHEVFAANNATGGGYEINLKGKPAGIYFVKLSEGNRVFTKKLVLQ